MSLCLERYLFAEMVAQIFRVAPLHFLDSEMASDDILNEINRRLADGSHPNETILFGSQAQDTTDDLRLLHGQLGLHGDRAHPISPL